MSNENSIFINNVEYFFEEYGHNNLDNQNINSLRNILVYWITNKAKGDGNNESDENILLILTMMQNLDIRNNRILWTQFENC